LRQKRAGELARVDASREDTLKKIALSILLASAAFVSPASANYFANPALNMKFNIGSAPTPTTWDIRHNYTPQMTRNNRSKVDYAKSVAPGQNADAAKADTAPALRVSSR
jgi:hypothetical protein